MLKPMSKLGSWSRDHATLDKHIGTQTRIWLDDKTKELLLDYVNIKYVVSNGGYVDNVHDYSYLIMPTFKALEGTTLQIGRELGFDIEKYKYKTGIIFNEENLEKYYEDVLNKAEDLDEEKKLDIKQWLDGIRRLLKSLRHNPAHYNGDVKLFEQAFIEGDTILFNIKNICLAFIESDLVTKGGNREKEEKAKREAERQRIKEAKRINKKILGRL